MPRIPVDQHLDLSYLYDSKFLQKKQRLTQVLQTLSHEDVRSPRNGENGESTKPNAGKGTKFNIILSAHRLIAINFNDYKFNHVIYAYGRFTGRSVV